MRFSPKRLLPAFERELPDRDILAWPDALDLDADIDAAERRASLVEEPLDVRLLREIGLSDRRSSELRGESTRALLPTVVVDEDTRPLGNEGAGRGRTDPARCARDHHSLALKSRVRAA